MFTHGRAWPMGGISATPIGRPLPSVQGGALGEEVELFLSTFVNKVDRKGRVSVPATFRSTLGTKTQPNLIVAFPSLYLPTLECAGSNCRVRT